METLLECRGITKHLQNYTIRDLSFCVNRGEILGLVGVNGCGKTTLMRVLIGSYRLDGSLGDAGEIVLDGMHFVRDRKEYRKRIAYVMTDNPFGDMYTAEQIGTLYGPYYEGFDTEKYKAKLEQFGVSYKTPIRKMSTGNGIRLQLAFAEGYDAELYIMDEPCGNLDPEFRNEFYDELRMLVSDERRAVILSSHLVTELENIADRLVWMRRKEKEGTVRMEGTVDEIRERFRMVLGDAGEISRIPADMVVGQRIRENHCEALVRRPEGVTRSEGWLPEELWETSRCADLQEIMYYVEKGDVK
ncbi:MAG: ABC transporter ATP-binding protein [Lachnospiraceae bacterium]|nr:ABC transporter ATP-binding protein [Lachnospiraceae bacterium]